MFKTKDGKTININALTGRMLYEILLTINPELARRIKKYIFKDDNILAFQANYRYGDKIINNKDVFLSLADGGSISVNDPSLPEPLKSQLSYTRGVNNLVGMIQNHASEFYVPKNDRIVSYGIIQAGQIFGYAHIIDAVMKIKPEKSKKIYVSNWDLNAGARLAFILPQISENQKHIKMLKSYGINVEKPTDYLQQSHTLQVLNASVDSPWTQSVVIFSRYLLDKLISDPQFMEAHLEFSAIHRSGYNIWHSAYPKWESDFDKVLFEADLHRYSPYAINIVKQMYLIGGGEATGVAPASDKSMVPLILAEDAYTDKGYGLTEHWPIMMQSTLLNAEKRSPVYYGINVPTLINYNPETFSGKTTIALLFQVYMIFTRLQEYLLNKFEDRESYLYEIATKMKCSFYHSNPDPKEYGEAIKSNTLLPEEDPRFYKEGYTFPHLSTLTRGCIKIELINS